MYNLFLLFVYNARVCTSALEKSVALISTARSGLISFLYRAFPRDLGLSLWEEEEALKPVLWKPVPGLVRFASSTSTDFESKSLS